MHKVFILVWFVVFTSLTDSKYVNNTKTAEIYSNNNGTILGTLRRVVLKSLNQVNGPGHLKSSNKTTSTYKNGTLLNAIVEKVLPKTQVQQIVSDKSNVSKSTELTGSERMHHSKDEVLKTYPILRKIHARITRSKDAVWAAITLTALCVLLLLAVAQSRMWKDHYYTESQGVPLPNFNERVLFKDVMERKISSLKQFFKSQKRTKEKNETELESLLPSSEWD